MLRPVFVAKGPHPSFYQILWPLCLQISGADHHKVTTIIGSSLHTKAPLQIWSGVWAPEHWSDEGWSPSHWYIELFPIRPICYQTAVWDHKCYKLLSCCFIVIITVLNYMLSGTSWSPSDGRCWGSIGRYSCSPSDRRWWGYLSTSCSPSVRRLGYLSTSCSPSDRRCWGYLSTSCSPSCRRWWGYLSTSCSPSCRRCWGDTVTSVGSVMCHANL